jgi:hypothetical protein
LNNEATERAYNLRERERGKHNNETN